MDVTGVFHLPLSGFGAMMCMFLLPLAGGFLKCSGSASCHSPQWWLVIGQIEFSSQG